MCQTLLVSMYSPRYTFSTIILELAPGEIHFFGVILHRPGAAASESWRVVSPELS